MTVCYKCIVSGRVQGVFYRATTRQHARQLNVTGYAKNLPDGRVEILACGTLAAVTALKTWLWQGSPAARVDDVQCHEVDVAIPQDFL